MPILPRSSTHSHTPRLPPVCWNLSRDHLNPLLIASVVLRMLSNYVGEEKFLKGVSLYLKKKLFANSKTHDLWEGIETATGLDIPDLMENWITKVSLYGTRGWPVWLTIVRPSDWFPRRHCDRGS